MTTTTSDDRVARYIARVDRHLPTLADDRARRKFLREQIEGWESRSADLQIRAAHGLPIEGDVSGAAFDIAMTIADLGKRLGALSRQVAEAA
jgi:hypothetical protein